MHHWTRLQNRARTLALLLIAGTLGTGCASNAIPDWRGAGLGDQAADLVQGQQPPAAVCEWPDLNPLRVAGVDGAFLDAGGLVDLERCRDRCDLTRDLAAANADSVDACVAIVEKQDQAGQKVEALAEDTIAGLRKDLRRSRLQTVGASLLAILAALAAL